MDKQTGVGLQETFGEVTVGGARTVTEEARPVPETGPTASVPLWKGWRHLVGTRTKTLPEIPAGTYRMYEAKDLFHLCGVRMVIYGRDRVERQECMRLDDALRRQGLRMAVAVSPPMGLKSTDRVGVFSTFDEPLSTRSSLPKCLFMVAWMAQSASAEPERILPVVDEWIDRQGAARTTTAAKATLRWMMSRRLTFSHRRKTRYAALRRLDRKFPAFMELVWSVYASLPPGKRLMERLATIYEVMGLETAQIHSDLHRAALKTVPSSCGSVSRKGGAGRGPARDLQAETRMARQLLSQVFDDDQADSPDTNTAESATPCVMAALDDILKGSDCAERLGKPAFAAIASRARLTPGALLEMINDHSYATVGEPLLEEDHDGTISVDAYVAQELNDLKNGD